MEESHAPTSTAKGSASAGACARQLSEDPPTEDAEAAAERDDDEAAAERDDDEAETNDSFSDAGG
eukprot:3154630-Prymnesium_polylepis.1